MDRVIEPLATGLGGSIGWMADHGLLFVVFALLWVAFGAALIWNQGSIDQAWATINGLPLILRAIVWLLFLPVMAGLWVWETSWPLVVRVATIVALAGWNLLVFLPRAVQTARP